ncbi:putative delta-1-pyrroline-5-carboxylate dehydrogenase [Leptospira wolbachii serovar Codice str. CDC]|uniref:L-glutamate gamma-semialdehyde dehydrogenase n=1 Tax=Leptospira wolbachii serovar Codice str. CDC TaxID=1218599 RepID=R9A787_9LEPT|nr:aldehyde dehydrogenase family protein [Leptospira wolbachii]EOQ96115.1 putative delta-1-pyrroline-5-carboxylate dehydrogenase [Leptospira wolbachii serovar Codice str. CDC]
MEFRNETIRDFSVNTERTALSSVLNSIKNSLPFEVPISVGGMEKFSANRFVHKNPWSPDLVVSKVSLAKTNDLQEAIEISKVNWNKWQELPQEIRSNILLKVAEKLVSKKDFIISVCVWETGKHITEAEIEFAEAVDFCRYYAMIAINQLLPKNVNLLGEDNLYYYKPKGIVGCISPWNFPMAIFTGMCAGPIVTGNIVIAKPAEETSATAYEITKCFWEAGVPKEIFHFLPGLGSEIGEAIVTHPEVSVINFTGSRDIGLSILQKASFVSPGQRIIKKVICELGGKNAMIVDADADLDVAIQCILSSAFGFQGQKCSALSRLFVHNDCYDKLKERLIAAMDGLLIGSPLDFENRVGPVIHEESYQRLLNLQKENESFLATKTSLIPDNGYYIAPSLYEPQLDSSMWTSEIFGPLLSMLKISSFSMGIKYANDSDYALTCGVISRNPKHLLQAKLEIEAGNLYVNRGITGAVVNRQPFGGGKLSGTGAKAGGPDYLHLFVDGKTYTENTMRQGFSRDTIQ